MRNPPSSSAARMGSRGGSFAVLCPSRHPATPGAPPALDDSTKLARMPGGSGERVPEAAVRGLSFDSTERAPHPPSAPSSHCGGEKDTREWESRRSCVMRSGVEAGREAKDDGNFVRFAQDDGTVHSGLTGASRQSPVQDDGVACWRRLPPGATFASLRGCALAAERRPTASRPAGSSPFRRRPAARPTCV